MTVIFFTPEDSRKQCIIYAAFKPLNDRFPLCDPKSSRITHLMCGKLGPAIIFSQLTPLNISTTSNHTRQALDANGKPTHLIITTGSSHSVNNGFMNIMLFSACCCAYSWPFFHQSAPTGEDFNLLHRR